MRIKLEVLEGELGTRIATLTVILSFEEKMTQIRILIPILALLTWGGIIVLFDRHDPVFYAASFLFCLTLFFLARAHTGPRFMEVKIEVDSADE